MGSGRGIRRVGDGRARGRQSGGATSPTNKLTRVRPVVVRVAPLALAAGGEHARECCRSHLRTRRRSPARALLAFPHADGDADRGRAMDVQYRRCAGLDVQKRTVVACVRLTTAEGDLRQEVRTFGTMTADLLALSDWLAGDAVEQVAMERTGVYWRPVFTVLEAGHPVLLVNPQHMRAVPGRTTAGKDAEWLADLLAHGLLQPSCIPPAPVRALRELVGYRTALVQARTQEINRVHQLLELGNIKLAAVATEVLGKSGRAMLDGLVAGAHDPEALAELARGRLRAKLPELRQAREGQLQPHHRLLLRQLLAHLDFLEVSLAEGQAEIDRHLVPFAEAVALAQTLPGVGTVAAAGLVAELGTDMSVSREYPPSVDGMTAAVPAGAPIGQDRPGSGSVQSRDGVWQGCCPHESARRASSDPPVMRGKAPRPSTGPRSAPDRGTGSSARRAPAGGGDGSPASWERGGSVPTESPPPSIAARLPGRGSQRHSAL
jgi:transposase